MKLGKKFKTELKTKSEQFNKLVDRELHFDGDILIKMKKLNAYFTERGLNGSANYAASQAHRILSDLLKVTANDLATIYSDNKVLKIMERDGIIIPFKNRMLPNDADAFCNDVSEFFSYYENPAMNESLAINSQRLPLPIDPKDRIFNKPGSRGKRRKSY